MIKIQNITKRYRNVNALDNLTLEIPRGTIYGLIGPNGAGKTTLIRILAALLSPTSGQVWFDGQEVSRSPGIIQRKVGYMPDFFGVYPDLTSTEYLEFFAGIHGVPRANRAQTITDLLELVDLDSKRDAQVESLSRGMKQRLCLARALVHDPDVLLLDEPASGLDPRARVELRELLRTLQGMDKTIIISSHILLEMAEMCTNVAIIQHGHLVLEGDVDQVTRRFDGARQLDIRILDAEQVPATIQLLQELKTISNIIHESSHDTLVHADFNGDDRAMHDVLATLIQHNITVISFGPRTGGGRLEEIFMSITEGSSVS